MKFIKQLYIEKNFYFAFLAVVVVFVLSNFYPALFLPAQALFASLLFFMGFDILILFSKNGTIKARRVLSDKFSNGDLNPVDIELENYYPFVIDTKIIDEIPFQFQERNFLLKKKLKKQSKSVIQYQLRPVERGEYFFGNLIAYVSSPLSLVSRRFNFDRQQMVPVYPSFIQLKKFELMTAAYRDEYGIKKVRRIGHTMEFEQIKDYIQGDDIRTINWKATAKKNQLMVNQFQDEKAQPVYNILDKGRAMKMPFEGMSLLDYAINSTLVISSATLKKHDKAGMFCFSKKVENRVVAEKRFGQMNLILENLYKIDTDYQESDFGLLYAEIKRNLKHRSLLFLYTNFETLDGMERQLAYLQAIAKHHVLVVIFFVNTELNQLMTQKAEDVQAIYQKTIAQKFEYEKRQIVKELRRRGVSSILTKPEDLTVNVINKYLEIKARGIL